MQRDWLQLCLMNNFVLAQKFANDAKTATENIYFIAAFTLLYCKCADVTRKHERG